MAKKKTEPIREAEAPILDQDVSDALKQNYMPYAMSVIVSRAIPEIDGFKPAHRKLLYTMQQMHLLTKQRTKSANIVGQTMKLNPHGDQAIYETMVRMARGNESLLLPFIDSKGNFGKVYSRDMAYAASRYTEAKLEQICEELFKGIDCNAVDMVDNYDGTMKEPVLLPTTYPNILVNANMGIAVGMASNVCSFNLREVCETTIRYMKDKSLDLLETLPAPDFSTGGEIIVDPQSLRQIYETGRGSIPVRAVWHYEAKSRVIEITEIPYSTTIEAIMDKIEELLKAGKFPEITDVRDESDLKGLRLTIDLKKGSDPESIMTRLFKMTSLQDNFACNFNILIDSRPQTLGVRPILDAWLAWRKKTLARILSFQKEKLSDQLHLLEGINIIMLDIDKAVRIIRGSKTDAQVLSNLMEGFGIDKKQANFVADIKLRNMNESYLMNLARDLNKLKKELNRLDKILSSEKKIEGEIEKELQHVAETYGQPRKSRLIEASTIKEVSEEDLISSYKAVLYLSREGYVKLQKSRTEEQTWKDGDETILIQEVESTDDFWVFTSKQQLYKAKIDHLPDCKPSQMGEYLPAVLNMDPEEEVEQALVMNGETMFLFFENGKAVSFPAELYNTKTARKKLKKAFCDKSRLVGAFCVPFGEIRTFHIITNLRDVACRTVRIPIASTRSAGGNQIVKLKKNEVIEKIQ